jgi:hypothetical protein
MWSVVLVDQTGATLEVLRPVENDLSVAVAFAAGFGSTERGVAVVVPGNPLNGRTSERIRLGATFNTWLAEVAKRVDFRSVTLAGMLCRAIRTHAIAHCEELGLDREACLDSFEWCVSGEQSIDDAELLTILGLKEHDETPDGYKPTRHDSGSAKEKLVA